MIFMVLLDVNVCLFSSRMLQIPPILIFNMSFFASMHHGSAFVAALLMALHHGLAMCPKLQPPCCTCCTSWLLAACSFSTIAQGSLLGDRWPCGIQVSDCPYMLSGCFTIKFDLAAHGKMGFVTPSWVDDKDWYRAMGPTVSG